MTVLSDRTLTQHIRSGYIGIDPFDLSQMQPASIDLTLGIDFLEPFSSAQIVDLNDVEGTMSYRELVAPAGYMLLPHSLVLATTVEKISVPNELVAEVEGKSSLARLGLCVHITAGFCDPGFRGRITLEMVNFNNRPIMLRPGCSICQVTFRMLDEPANHPYGDPRLNSKYQDQNTTTGSKYAV